MYDLLTQEFPVLVSTSKKTGQENLQKGRKMQPCSGFHRGPILVQGEIPSPAQDGNWCSLYHVYFFFFG